MTSNNTFLSSSVAPVTHGPYHSALVGASRAVSSVNSSAIVQVRPNMPPVQFHTIRLNTDLNRLPQDWAKTKFQCYGFHNPHENAFSPFSSVNMAHNYKDLVGKVDVISSSKNIKDLLKMPYQQSPHISLMVHRLGKTLLLEEFDVHKNLIKKDAEDWQWLNDFFRRYMHKREDKKSSLALLNSPKKDPLSDEMYRNLIRHSITASVAGNACISVETTNEVPWNIPQFEEESQDLKGFHHESLWKFHNRSMLVDSDLPIFGTDSKCPCISLRLRDSPPINVLTGLDYWLDNLMSNVPEVAMVYHLNGFVQKYEILRTEDIPNMENSSFDPEEVMELARNILAFIKSRAAIEGHTYWLYKSENDDMVKLYDLTEYCKKELRTGDNPFTVPVGLLCYHVGRNLKVSGQRRSADCRAMLENCLRLLIEEKHTQICADAHFLLSDMWVPDKSLYDIWQGDKIADPPDDLYDEDEYGTDDSGEFEHGNSQREEEKCPAEEENNLVSFKSMSLQKKNVSPHKSPRKRDEKNEVALQELVVRGMIKRRAWDVLKVCRIAGETDERCREALRHIRKGLSSIDKDLSRLSRPVFKGGDKASNPSLSVPVNNGPRQNRFSSSNLDLERDQIRVAKPFVPIPLHYSPIKPHSESPLSKDSDQDTASTNSHSAENGSQQTQESDSSSNGCDNGCETSSWHSLLKFQLLRKAAIAFHILANQFHDSLQKRGHTLRYVRYGLHCYECLFVGRPKRDPDVLEEEIYYHLIYLAAKARSCLDSNIWATSHKDYEELNEEEAAILHSAQAILQKPKEAWVYTWSENEENNLLAAKALYKKVMKMKVFEKKPPVQRNIIWKQYAVCVMNLGNVVSKALRDKVAKGETFEQVEPLMEKSKSYCEESLALFTGFNEKNTAAHCQFCIAKVYEYAAESLEKHTHDDLHPISKEEFKVLHKMFDACEKTLSIYDRDESTDDAREDVYHFLRNKYFTLATRYFKCRTTEGFKISKELLHKSLAVCFLDPKNRHFKKSQRIGAIDHYNLAIFCHEECKIVQMDSPHYRSLRRKMYDHLQSAFDLYSNLRWCRSQIAVKAFLVDAILEDLEIRLQSTRSQKKSLRCILHHCCSLQQAVDCIHTDQAEKEDDCQTITTLFDGVKIILEMINKAFIKWLKLEKSSDLYTEVKHLYQRTLRQTLKSEVEFIAFPLSQILADISNLLASDHCN